MINYLSFQFSPNKGKILENLVFLELAYQQGDDRKIYYWQDYQHREVDFVIKQERKIIQIIQVVYSLNEIDTRSRELKALAKASENLQCNNLTILTFDEEGEERIGHKKVSILPVWKWILMK